MERQAKTKRKYLQTTQQTKYFIQTVKGTLKTQQCVPDK